MLFGAYCGGILDDTVHMFVNVTKKKYILLYSTTYILKKNEQKKKRKVTVEKEELKA
jgi:hypothetical protein